MANVLTDLAADIYVAADIVGHELQGFIPSVTLNAGTERVAMNDTVRSHVTRKPTVNASITPSMTIPEGDDQTVDSKTATIDKVANVQIPWTGEDIRHVNNGSGYGTIYGDQIAQAFRSISNQVESDIATAAYKGASRAVGAAGTTPFGSNHNVVNEAIQILKDNGMPTRDGRMSLVMNTNASTNMLNLANLQKVNESGNDTFLRQGRLLDLGGAMMKESAQISAHTKGTATGLDADGAGAVDDTTIALNGGDGGSLLSGDVVTFAGDTNKYVVNTGFTAASGDAVIGGPGLREALTDGAEMTIGNSYAANVLFHQTGIELAIRAMEDSLASAAQDRMIVQDPHSGLVFTIDVYGGYKKAMIDISVVYGVKVWKEDAVALLLG